MAYDIARNKVVVFGGEIDGWLAGDTWEWDPATRTWAEKPASSLVYGGLFGPAMAYDPNRHQVILFGGRAYYNWGEGATWAWDGTNWNNITPGVYPPPRFIHAMATDLTRSKVVMFGGKNNSYALTDTWEWDGNAWTQVALSGAVPPARDDPAMTYDATRHVTGLFGGVGYNDTWSWNGVAWSLEHPQTSPSPRSTSVVYDSSQSKLVLFSGAAPTDTWYSQTTSGLPTITAECSATVTPQVATDNCVGQIVGTTADPTTYNAQGTYTVHWTYNDGNGNSSTQSQIVIVKDTTAPVIALNGASSMTIESCSTFVDPGATASDNCAGNLSSAIVVTGNVNTATPGSYLLHYNVSDASQHPATEVTRTINVVDTTPPSLTLNGSNPITVELGSGFGDPGATASDSCAGNLTSQIALTGSVNTGAVGSYSLTYSVTDGYTPVVSKTRTVNVVDTTAPAISNLPGGPQVFDWIQINSNGTVPAARNGHRMVFDSARSKVIMFGGQDAQGNYLNDIWELDTASNIWTNVTPSTGAMPIPRSNFGMAYDPARSRVVIYGGQVSSQYSNVNITGDTWEWDGPTHTWIAKPSASTIDYVGRLGSGLAYDPNRHQVILFGGRPYWDFGINSTGTYAWDGNTWLQLNVQTGPVGRGYQGMSTDLSRSKVVLFGGYNGNLLGDTWEWNGNSWTPVAPAGAGPFMRSVPAMAYDSVRHTTVLFGGSTGNVASDTWEWNGTIWTMLHPQIQPSARQTSMVYDSAHSRLVVFSGGSLADTWYSQTTSAITVEATSPAGAVVSWPSPMATDLSGSVAVTCSPASGSTFPLGNTIVQCTATDAQNNTGYAGFIVTVRDTTAPALSCSSADGNWHGNDVSIACTATDGGSGLATQAEAKFVLSTSVAGDTETANASTGIRTVCDVVGNCAMAGPVGGNKVDKKTPTINLGSADGQWHAVDVVIAATASDGGSGLANPAETNFTLSTNVASGVESSNASTNSRNICDAVNNCVTAGPVSGNKVDRKPPSIVIETPTAGVAYVFNSAVAANYSCSDLGSGVALCTGSAPNGSNINTGSLGQKTFKVSGTDNFGYTSTNSVQYFVKATTTTKLTSSVNPAAYGISVTFMANVNSPDGAPIGNVQFFDGTSLIGTAILSSGKAKITTAAFSPGSHAVTAIYTGSDNFLPSTSPVLSETVDQASTSTTITSSKNPSNIYAAVTFTAQVSAAGSVPNGYVKFFVDDIGYAPILLDASGQAAQTYQFLTAGPRTIKAVYLGTSSFAGSGDSVNQMVKPR